MTRYQGQTMGDQEVGLVLRFIFFTSIAVFVKADLNTNVNITYVFPENTCSLSSKPRHTNTTQLFIFEFDGKQIPNDCRQVALHSADETDDKYKLCVTPVSFIDPICSLTVEFQYNGNKMIFDCNTTETNAFCTNEETQLFIKTMAIVGFENANFTFTVKNVISTTYIHEAVTDVGMIAGIIVGCLLAVVIIVIACYIYVRGRNTDNSSYHAARS